MTLEAGVPLDLEEDSPELEAELLKAANGPFTPLLEGELREIANLACDNIAPNRREETGAASRRGIQRRL